MLVVLFKLSTRDWLPIAFLHEIHPGISTMSKLIIIAFLTSLSHSPLLASEASDTLAQQSLTLTPDRENAQKNLTSFGAKRTEQTAITH